MRSAILLALFAALGASPARAQAGAIVGDWQGSSICEKASWNAACRDEEVLYHVHASAAQPGRYAVDASKRVAGGWEPMYALDGFRYDARQRFWTAHFSNDRVYVVWTYRIQGDAMTGLAVEVRQRHVVRRVTAHRVR